ncbi:TIGR02587 family membrane protein [Pararhizobium capsulatum]|uniref:TIGR02587 family membrane protein n=1 Tax=Pararhizobium capsulatum TaxID=34014 RepID=UPI0027D91D3A|nr:TIGR02587 family membrane protein [Pararhizobium capsulatum]
MGLGRGIGGALLFALPMQMTMEMWALGFTMERWRLVLLLLVALPLLVGIAHKVGFEQTFGWKDDFRDAVIAYALGILTSGFILCLFRLLEPGMPWSEVIGKIAVQSIPASMGALLGRSQLGSAHESGDDDKATYGGELFLMAVGALFLNLNMAPTEEMILISYKMTTWHALAVIAASLIIMHAFVYAVSFKGGHEISDDTPKWHAFFRFTLPGYTIALLISLYSLWTFERLDGSNLTPAIMAMVVLAFPGAIGASAARLII